MSQAFQRFQTLSLFLLLIAFVVGLEGWRRGWFSSSAVPIHAEAREEDEREKGPTLQRIKLAEPDLGNRLGFETCEAKRRSVSRLIHGNAETAYDGRRMVKVFARVPGIVRDLKAEPLQKVARGDVVAIIDSSLVGSTKAQYLAALAAHELAFDTMERMKALTSQEIVPLKNELESRASLNQAKSNLMDAELKLRNLGFRESDIKNLAQTRSTDSLMEVHSPIDGYVTAWDVNIGEAVEPTAQLFALVDTTRMWLWIDVYESDISKIREGQPVHFTISGDATEAFQGSVAAISTEVNPTTRTTRVRATLNNDAGRLRANQFGKAAIEIAAPHEATVLPITAIQRDNDAHLVFIALTDDTFEPRVVETRPTGDKDWMEIITGVTPGERVVTIGSFPLYSQLFKDRIIDEVD